MVIKTNPEFGIELALTIPYAYYLHTQNKLKTVITSKGMKPFYYFCNDVREEFTHSRNRRRSPRYEKSPEVINEKMIKRFLRKCKKERIVNEYKEKKSHFISKKQKRKQKKRRQIIRRSKN